MAKFTLNLDGPLLKTPSNISGASFDYVGRYQLIGEIIKRYYTEAKPKQILDVGGLGSILDQLIDVPVTILDNELTESTDTQKLGDGARMDDIKDDSYEVVVTSDTLEHIPPDDRKSFIQELVRVSSDLIIICAPFGDYGAAEQEAALQEIYTGLKGAPHRWLQEHVDYGLPTERSIASYIPSQSAISHVIINHSKLKLWRDLLAINLLANDMDDEEIHDSAKKINQLYNHEYLFKDFSTKSYRSFFVISKTRELSFEQPKASISPEAEAELYKQIVDFYEHVLRRSQSMPLTQQQLAESRHKLDELAGSLQTLQANLDRVLHSKTWRYTEFGRKGVRGLKKVRRTLKSRKQI